MILIHSKLIEWNLQLLSFVPVHFHFKGCWLVFFQGLDLKIECVLDYCLVHWMYVLEHTLLGSNSTKVFSIMMVRVM